MEPLGIERRVAVIIEDDADIRHLLETVLAQAGFDAIGTNNGLDGVQAVRTHDPVVTTIDVSMPGMDGFETARRIRAFSTTYIVMLTARDEEADTLQGLEAGADDYVTKPFRPRELRARVEAMLRRPRQLATTDIAAAPVAAAEEPVTAGESVTTALAQPTVALASPGPGTGKPAAMVADSTGWLEHNGLRLNPDMRLATLDGTKVELTRTEFDLLEAILDSQRRVRSKANLALLLHGESYLTDNYVNEADKRAVEVHIGNLRRKLGDSSTAPRWIETVRGVGYRLAAPDEG